MDPFTLGVILKMIPYLNPHPVERKGNDADKAAEPHQPKENMIVPLVRRS